MSTAGAKMVLLKTWLRLKLCSAKASAGMLAPASAPSVASLALPLRESASAALAAKVCVV